ncbi:MAG: HAMP domain-containing histidine kinase [Defluviitaleaceae bacterium]|nr:HAMP domain-containing histidine kinase [Defluviitaleaceae bacterium]
MTIKRRLFISNILMTIAPFVISVVTMWGGLFLLNYLSGGELEIVSRGGAGARFSALTDSDLQAVLLTIGVILFFATIVVVTNRLLTKFVFRKIMQPLEMLMEGVGHISEGDLDFRITHADKDEFKGICEAFNNMAQRLKVADEVVHKNEQNRKELFASISHDLRSPLTSIKAFSEGLIDGVAVTPEAQQEYLHIIKQKSEEVNAMISQLFLYSKMDMGSYPTNAEVLDIGQEIEEFAAVSDEDYRARGLAIKIVGTTSKVNINADPLQLRSIFTNILDNSAKYKNKDEATAKITCLAENGYARIIFEDNGTGVGEEALPKLFEAFYRTDPARNNPEQGSGLGLAIAKKALERMGGSIAAENVACGGLRMIIKIPIIGAEVEL